MRHWVQSQLIRFAWFIFNRYSVKCPVCAQGLKAPVKATCVECGDSMPPLSLKQHDGKYRCLSCKHQC